MNRLVVVIGVFSLACTSACVTAEEPKVQCEAACKSQLEDACILGDEFTDCTKACGLVTTEVQTGFATCVETSEGCKAECSAPDLCTGQFEAAKARCGADFADFDKVELGCIAANVDTTTLASCIEAEADCGKIRDCLGKARDQACRYSCEDLAGDCTSINSGACLAACKLATSDSQVVFANCVYDTEAEENDDDKCSTERKACPSQLKPKVPGIP